MESGENGEGGNLFLFSVGEGKKEGGRFLLVFFLFGEDHWPRIFLFPYLFPISLNLNNFFISFDFSTKEEEDFLKRRDRAYIIIKHSIFYVKSADNVKILRTVYRFFFFLTNINELCPLIVHRTSEK